jgi:DNA polymerase-3 subunit epsilon
LHGALLDAEILADVYLLMTGGQVNLNINQQSDSESGNINSQFGIRRLTSERPPLKIIRANETELKAHNDKLSSIQSTSGTCIWRQIID